MDQNNGPEAKISKGETRILLTIDLGELPLLPTRISLQDQFLYMGITIRIMEDRMINTKISHSTEMMETDPKTDHSTIRMETGETMETFLVLHRLKGETLRKIVHTASQEVISLTFLLFADLTTDLLLVLHLTNRSSHKTIIRPYLMLFVSPQPMMPLIKYQIFAHYPTKVSQVEHRQISKLKT